MAKVVAVTGGNRGIGFEIVKQIAEKIQGTVYLTARSEAKGNEAVAKIQSGLGPGAATIKFHQLDVTDEKSVETFKQFLKTNHGGLDILVNNAGVFLTPSESDSGIAMATAPGLDLVKPLIDVNYYGVKRVTEALLPLIKANGRVVFNASRVGNVQDIDNEEVRKTILSPTLSPQVLDKVIADFMQAVKDKKTTERGYPNDPYYVSQAASVAYSRLIHRRLAGDSRPGILVNASCPGFVISDMTQSFLDNMKMKEGDSYGIFHKSRGMTLKTAAQAADSLVWCAILPEGTKEPNGQFVGERQVLNLAEMPTVAQLEAKREEMMKEKK